MALPQLELFPATSIPGSNPVSLTCARIVSGQPLRVLDLFSGCGGLSLGLERAGFEIVGGVETDLWAARTCEANLHGSAEGIRREVAHKPRDIRSISPHDLLADLGFEDSDGAIDV